MEDVARTVGVPFHGLWLTADRATLLARVAARRGDASDATPDVVEQQIARGAGNIGWTRIDAGGAAAETLRGAGEKLGVGSRE